MYSSAPKICKKMDMLLNHSRDILPVDIGIKRNIFVHNTGNGRFLMHSYATRRNSD
jgi:hypothetical protein